MCMVIFNNLDKTHSWSSFHPAKCIEYPLNKSNEYGDDVLNWWSIILAHIPKAANSHFQMKRIGTINPMPAQYLAHMPKCRPSPSPIHSHRRGGWLMQIPEQLGMWGVHSLPPHHSDFTDAFTFLSHISLIPAPPLILLSPYSYSRLKHLLPLVFSRCFHIIPALSFNSPSFLYQRISFFPLFSVCSNSPLKHPLPPGTPSLLLYSLQRVPLSHSPSIYLLLLCFFQLFPLPRYPHFIFLFSINFPPLLSYFSLYVFCHYSIAFL